MLYQVGELWHEDYNGVRATFDTRPQAEWFALTGETLSAAEAAIAMGVYMAKQETARAIVAAVKTLTTMMDDAGNLVQRYWDPPCGGTFTDDDLAALGITAEKLTTCITLLEQCALLFSGANDGAGHSTITPAVYRVTVNTVREVT